MDINIHWSCSISSFGNFTQIQVPPLECGELGIKKFAEELSKILQPHWYVTIHAHQINPAKGYVAGGVCRQGVWSEMHNLRD